MSQLLDRAAKCETLLRSGEALLDHDAKVSSAIEVCQLLCKAGYYRQALRILSPLDSSLGAGGTRLELRLIYTEALIGLSQLPEARKVLHEVFSELHLAEGESSARVELRARNLMGLIYWESGRLDDAEKVFSAPTRSFSPNLTALISDGLPATWAMWPGGGAR